MDVGLGGLCLIQDTPTALLSRAFAPRLGGAICRVTGFHFWAPGPRGGSAWKGSRGGATPPEPAPLCSHHHVGHTLFPMYWLTPEVRTPLSPPAGRPGVG